jgi:hypothetical protein
MRLSAPANGLRGVVAPLVGPVLVALCWSGPALETGRAQMTQPELRKIVLEALANDAFSVREPVVRSDEDALRLYGEDVLRFKLGPVGLEKSFDSWEGFDFWSYPVRDQELVELIRKTRPSAGLRLDWKPYLERAETVIAKELALIGRYEKQDKKQGDAAEADKKRDKLEGLLQGYHEYTERILISCLDGVAEQRGQVALPTYVDTHGKLVPSDRTVRQDLPGGAEFQTQPELRKFVREALAKNAFFIGKPVVTYDEDALRFYGEDVLRFELGAVDLEKEGFGLRSYPVRDQFLVELIRKTRPPAELRLNWKPYLERAETVIAKELALIGRYEKQDKKQDAAAEADKKRDKLEDLLQGYDEYTERILISCLDDIAEQRGQVAVSMRGDGVDLQRKLPDGSVEFRLGHSITEAFQQGSYDCTVKIVTEPEGAAVYYLPERAYCFKERAGLTEDPKNWLAAAGDSIHLFPDAKYRFYARWGKSGKTVISAVRITKGQTIVLRP